MFIEYNAFLLQFTDKDNKIVIHINDEAAELAIQENITRLKAEASSRKIIVRDGSYYTISQEGDEYIRLEFTDKK